MKLPVVASTLVVAVGLVAYIVTRAPSSSVGDSPSRPTLTAVAAPVSSATPHPATPPRSHPTRHPRQSARVRRPIVGITVPSIARLDRFVAATHTTPTFVGIFEDWAHDRPFPREFADAVAARGARLSITWEPWNNKAGTVDQPRYSLSSIIAGRHDSYIDAYARAIQRYPHPVNVRLMHEMNGFWYPWARGVNGNKPGQYVQAWRHVHERFALMGVTNVRWMWAPNAIYPGAGNLARLYPGPAYVDRVGIDNYNWGDRTHDGVTTHWQGFRSLFQPTINRLRHVTHKPVWISEVGSLNVGGSKAAWITRMFEQLKRSPEIAGLMYFDVDDSGHHADWKIENEPLAAHAWAAGTRGRYRVDRR